MGLSEQKSKVQFKDLVFKKLKISSEMVNSSHKAKTKVRIDAADPVNS